MFERRYGTLAARTFCVIADTLNFTKASERLNLTQSAVSHQIKSLEDELGVKLFVRGKRGVKLTDAGRSAVESSRRILDEAESMRQQVAGREQALAGQRPRGRRDTGFGLSIRTAV